MPDVPEGDYELIPMSPIRRLEKRLEKVESLSYSDPKNIFRDIIDIVRMNQMIVDELCKANDALRIELARLPAKLDELIMSMKEIITFIKSSGEEETSGMTKEVMKPVVDKLDEMVKTNKTITEKNDSMLELLDEIGRKLKSRSVRMPVRPLLPQASTQPTQPLRKPKPIY